MPNYIPAFTRITGSSYGGYSAREMCADIIEFADDHGAESAETITAAWRDLAMTADEDIAPEEYEGLCDNLPLPPSCSITWQDNELIVLPFIDDEIPRLSDYPETYCEDVVYVVSDHGNVTCQEWNGTAYQTVWDMC